MINNAAYYVGLFNAREQASIIWFLLFLIVALSKADIRNAFWGTINALFHAKLLAVICAMSLYIGLLILILARAGIWDATLAKNTIFWFGGTAFVLLISTGKAEHDEGFLKNSLLANLKLVLVIEFVANFYTFNLWVELILMPLLCLIIAMSAYVEKKGEYASVKKLVDFALVVFGVAFLSFSCVKIGKNYGDFMTSDNLRAFVLPPLLTFTYVPFLYLTALFMTYESLFLRIDIFLKNDRVLAKFLKQRIFILTHIDLEKLNRFSREYTTSLVHLNNKDDMINLLCEFK
ncbi:hypothetical protein ACFL6Y_06585 [Elusimicrobiota bacterium]